MKKFFLASLFILLGTFAFAQDAEENTDITDGNNSTEEITNGGNSTDKKVVGEVIRETRSKDFCHWMMTFGGGFNLMMVERDNGTQTDPLKGYRDCFQGAAYFNFGYMINPIWGVIAEYGFIPINKKIFTKEGNVLGIGHEATLHLDFNILNLVRKCRKNTKWNVDALVGAGFMAYNRKGENYDKYKMAVCIPVTLKFQYCPRKEIGIGFRVTGKWYSEDDINWISRQNSLGSENHNNDMALYAGFELQYNITTKGKSHVRVTDRCTYEPMNVVLESKIVDINKNKEKIDVIEKDLDEVKEDVAILNGTAEPDKLLANSEYAKKIAEMQAKIDSLANLIGVMYNNPTVNTNVDQSKALTIGNITAPNSIVYKDTDSDNGIYFDFDSDKIESGYYKDVIKIAKRMLNDNKLKIKITGYCDSKGSVEYNKKLAQRRINAIVSILVNRFRIDRARMATNNFGKVEGPNEIDDLNRRIDVEYYY